MAEKITTSYLKKYIGKSADVVIKDFPQNNIRILFPQMAYTQNYCKDRINVVLLDGKITRIWKD